MELLATVEIPNYVRFVTTTESRRATYYEKGKKKVPDKWLKQVGVNCEWLVIKGKTLLCDAEGKPIVSNPKAVGTPKGVVICGNDLHSLTMQDYTRSKIIKAIKADMIPHVEKLDPITKFPIRILFELHDTFMDYMYVTKEGNPIETGWDLDNRALFYAKVFPDVLQGNPMIKPIEKNADGKWVKKLAITSKRIIPNDSRVYITQAPCALFVPIEDTKDRKLVFKIYHDDREVIKNSSAYELHRKESL